MPDPRPLSGTQYSLAAHGYAATIASVGASLRELALHGRALVVPFEADEVRPAYRGAVLAPWPNRVVDGRYELDGETQKLALSEPDRGHALHGLALWLDFALVSRTDEAVTLTATIEAQTGYPATVGLTVAYELTDHGLVTTVRAENLAGATVPYGAGPHPYLVAGSGTVDDWALLLPADEVLLVDDVRLIPQSLAPVDAHGFDFRAAHTVDDLFIDHAFTGLPTAAEVRVDATDGHGVGMRWDAASLPWVQVHTADRPDAPEISRIGLAVEPMTCPPDAFNSGTDVIRLAPGDTHSASWELFGY